MLRNQDRQRESGIDAVQQNIECMDATGGRTYGEHLGRFDLRSVAACELWWRSFAFCLAVSDKVRAA